MLFELLKNALKNIEKNKMRSFLTMLGIIIGISSVTIMISIGLGVQQQVKEQIGGMGVNLITVFPGSFRQGRVIMGAGSRLTIKDAEKLKKEAFSINGVSPVYRTSVQVIGSGGNWYTSLYGVSEDFFKIRNYSFSSGEGFSENHVRIKSKVCVLGYTVATNIGLDEEGVGEEVRIQKDRFKVIGVLAPKGTSGGMGDQDDLVLIPYSTYESRISRGRYIQQIIISATSEDKMDEASEEIRKILRESHKLTEESEDDFTIRTQLDILETFTQTTTLLTIFLASIAGISLLVGGVGIMNIMLVSVTERTREIGIRMAVGAKEKDILLQFLTEAVALCVIGGILGIITGITGSFLLENIFHVKVVFYFPVFLLSFSFSIIVGVFFGFYPAKRASRMNPVEALRYE